jgi:hypothetical protein
VKFNGPLRPTQTWRCGLPVGIANRAAGHAHSLAIAFLISSKILLLFCYQSETQLIL